MRTPWILLLLAFIVTACGPTEDVLPPSPPRALDVTNVGGQAWLSPEDFDNSESLQARWAPPWDVWGDEWYIMYTPYSQIMGRPAHMSFYIWDNNWVGRDVGGQRPLVYERAYVLNAKTKEWSPISLEGNPSTKYSGFIEFEREESSYTYTYYDEDGEEQTETVYETYYTTPMNTIAPDKFSEGDNYIATYICSAMVPVSYRNYKYTYACGCLEDDLETCGRWNIQRLTVDPAPTCGNNRCEIGEDPWTCTQDCLDGPNAPVALADEEAEGANFCELWNAGSTTCELAVGSDEARLTLTNEGEEDVRFDEMTVLQWSDDVDCEFSTVTVAAGETVTAYASCNPPITSIGTTEFGIEGFATIGETGTEFWGWARTQVANYRDAAPEDSDAALIEFIGAESTVNTDSLSDMWIGEGETRIISFEGKDYEITLLAVDVNGRVLFMVNGEIDVQPTLENQRLFFDTRLGIVVKDVIVREGVEQPPNSVDFTIESLEGDVLVRDRMDVVSFPREYTVNGKTYVIQLIQVAGKRASIQIKGPELVFADVFDEGSSRMIDYSNNVVLRINAVTYQGIPDPCLGETMTCSGLTAVRYSCIEQSENGFENFAWSFYKGEEQVCDEACSEGYCTEDGVIDGPSEVDVCVSTSGFNCVEFLLQHRTTPTTVTAIIQNDEGNTVTITEVENCEVEPATIPNGETTTFSCSREGVLEEGRTTYNIDFTYEVVGSYPRMGQIEIRTSPNKNACAELHANEGFRFDGDRDFRFYEVNPEEQMIVLREWGGDQESSYTYIESELGGTGEIIVGGTDYEFKLYEYETTYIACVDGAQRVTDNNGQQIKISEGDTVILKEYADGYVSGQTEVVALFISNDGAKFLVDGETTDTLGEDDWDTASGKRLKVTKHIGKGMPVSFIVHEPVTDFEAVTCGYVNDTFVFHSNHTRTFTGTHANEDTESAVFEIGTGGTTWVPFVDWGDVGYGEIRVGHQYCFDGDCANYRFRLDQGNDRICFEEGVEVQVPPSPENPPE